MCSPVCLLLLALIPAAAAAGDDTRAAPQIIKGPYVQHMLQDAVTIMWETDSPADSTVRYFFGGDWHDAHSPDQVKIHEVRLQGFSASAIVAYSVESTNAEGNAESSQAIFRTAPPVGTPFRMCVWGDNQERPEVFSQHVARMIVDAPDLLLACGDVVNTGANYSEWESRFLGPLRPLIQYTPMIVAIGNHEADSHWFYDFLAQPGNEHWFSYTYGNAFFLVLDTNYPFHRGTEQYQFALEALLSEEAQNATWVVAVHHHPPYSEIYEEGTYAQLREHLIPLYESAGVDINFHGHIHDYERGEFVPDSSDRRIWQVQTSGGGGTLWYDEFDGDWEQIDLVILDQFHYCVVDVGAEQLTLKAVNLDGDVIDSFTIDAAPRDGVPPPDGGDDNHGGPSQWDFGAGDLAATYGPGSIEFADGPAGPTSQQSAFGSTAELGLPPIAGEPAEVLRFPRATANSMGFRIRPDAPANAGGVYVNDYTIIVDMLVPQSSFNGDDWLALYNTNATNTNDADLWVRLSDGGLGVAGVYQGSVPADLWRRLAFVFDHEAGATTLRKYIDGVPVGSQDLGGRDGRWSLYTRSDPTPWFYLFTDDSGQVSTAAVSSIHFADHAMNSAEIAALGPADADGVLPDPDACEADWTGDGDITTQDVLAFLNDWANHDPGADLNDDGLVNSQDFLAFLNLWAAGCD